MPAGHDLWMRRVLHRHRASVRPLELGYPDALAVGDCPPSHSSTVRVVSGQAVVRRFLKRHRDQVLIVIFEDYVAPPIIEAAFTHAGLDRYVTTRDRHAPLPTPGTLIARGHRLVFAEEGRRAAVVHACVLLHAGHPLGAVRPSQLSCERYRGEASTPLLLINHWIPPFPPSPSLNMTIGRERFLRSRVERCRRERRVRGAIVAVDFYERTSVVAVARALNGASDR